MNRVILNGRITKDVDMKYTLNTKIPVVNFTLAVQNIFKNQNGEYDTNFINCVSYKKNAELMKEYVKKGDMLSVEGSINTRSYENSDKKKVFVTEVLVERLEFLQNKSSNKQIEVEEPAKEEVKEDDPYEQFSYEVNPDDLPF